MDRRRKKKAPISRRAQEEDSPRAESSWNSDENVLPTSDHESKVPWQEDEDFLGWGGKRSTSKRQKAQEGTASTWNTPETSSEAQDSLAHNSEKASVGGTKVS